MLECVFSVESIPQQEASERSDSRGQSPRGRVRRPSELSFPKGVTVVFACSDHTGDLEGHGGSWRTELSKGLPQG